MSKFTDQDYLKDEQYRDPTNLDVRIALHQKFSTSEVLWVDWIYQHLAIETGQQVLAVGSGNATQWQENVSRFPQDAQFALMDLSHGMVASGREGIGPDDPRFGYLTGDAQTLPFPDAQFDRVTANHMLYHVPSMEAAVAECARVVKPDGLFLAATNGKLHMTDLYDLLEAFEPGFRMPDNDRRRFGLRNGGAYLEAAFAEVRRDLYPCDLWVTDPDALVGYVFSMWDLREGFTPEKADELRRFIIDKMGDVGGIKIRKETGIFIASHTPGLIDSLGILQAEQELP
ncbi:class I SAM-dependent methyltransferase [bacterium]|nr:class I SAM-dependent methyltransferase [bacterium]